jgi:hypothetical protein
LIRDILRSDEVRRALAKHYRQAVYAAVKNYVSHSADEDAATGGLGQAITGEGDISVAGRTLTWKTRYRKLRGRGPEAPEKALGADGIFEIELLDEDGSRSTKTLPFQAKNNISSYGGSKLREQANKIEDLPGGGIIINYRPTTYVVVPAGLVAKGAATLKDERPLADSLAEDFLECKTGSVEYVFDSTRQEFLRPTETGLLRLFWAPGHRIRTTLKFQDLS